MTAGWKNVLVDADPRVVHCLPENDAARHSLTVVVHTDAYGSIFCSLCSCRPTVRIIPDALPLIVHNSFDGWEAVEEANRILAEASK